MKKQLVSILISLLLVALQLLPLAGVYRNPVVERLENLFYDLRIQVGLPAPQDPRITIVEIDDASLAREGYWPWPRKRIARLVERLFEDYGVQALGMDVVFAEGHDHPALPLLEELAATKLAGDASFSKVLAQLRPDLEEDRLLADTLARYPVVLGYYFLSHGSHTAGQLPEPVRYLETDLERALPLPLGSGYVSNVATLQKSAWSGGFFDNPAIDGDGIIRRVALLERYGDALYESFSLAVLRVLLGSPPVELLYAGERDDPALALEGLDVGGIRIPTDEQGAALVPYRGPYRTFAYVSASDVLRGTTPPGLLAERIALLGFTAPGLMDVRPTPVQRAFPGVEVHANLISGMLDGDIRQRPAYAPGLDFLQMLLVGLLLTLLLPWLPPLATAAVVLLVTLAVTGANYAAWNHGIVLPLAGVVNLILTLTLFHAAWGYFVETRNKRHISRLFGQFVPPEVVDEMSRGRTRFRLEGENREMTVLFSDVRGFTPICEALQPQQVTRLVNLFLTWQTEILYRHRGTVEKYTGDGVTAFWGAPLPDPLHARNALRSALEMRDSLPQFNRQLEQEGLPTIRFGVGLNTGMMTVGNMGSKYRMVYSIQGDSVNLGARIESLTKFYGVTMLVSGTVKSRVAEYRYRLIDRVRVKGKQEPVELYEPLGPESELDGPQQRALADYEAALAHYHGQDWSAARTAFQALAAADPQQRIYHIYLERLEALIAAPPEGGFDGVFDHTSK